MANEKIGLGEIMKKAQEMQSKLKEIQEDVAKLKVIGQAASGVVKISMTGNHYATEVVFDPALMQEDRTVLQELIAAAINDCTDKIERSLREKMGGLAGMQMPDGFGD